MTKATAQREAFIVRIWREAEAPTWQGWVQHVRTQEARCVRNLDELVAFIEGRIAALPPSHTIHSHLK